MNSAQSMILLIQGLVSGFFELQLDARSSVADLKACIASRDGVPSHQQTLMSGKRLLVDCQPIAEVLHNYSTVNVAVPLCGGDSVKRRKLTESGDYTTIKRNELESSPMVKTPPPAEMPKGTSAHATDYKYGLPFDDIITNGEFFDSYEYLDPTIEQPSFDVDSFLEESEPVSLTPRSAFEESSATSMYQEEEVPVTPRRKPNPKKRKAAHPVIEETFELEVNAQSSVMQVKEAILKRYGYPLKQQRLIHQGEKMVDKNALSQYELVREGDVIYLVLHQRKTKN